MLGYKPPAGPLQARIEPSLLYEFPLPNISTPGTVSTLISPGLNSSTPPFSSKIDHVKWDPQSSPKNPSHSEKLDEIVTPNKNSTEIRNNKNVNISKAEQNKGPKPSHNPTILSDNNRESSLCSTKSNEVCPAGVKLTEKKTNLCRDSMADLDGWHMGPPESTFSGGIPQYDEFLAIHNSFTIKPPRLSIGSIERADGRCESQSHSPD